jgi:hypothetical protein
MGTSPFGAIPMYARIIVPGRHLVYLGELGNQFAYPDGNHIAESHGYKPLYAINVRRKGGVW